MPIRKKSRTAFSFLNRPKKWSPWASRLGIISFSLEEAWFAWVPYSKKELKENAKALTNRIRQVTYVVDENMSSSQREPSDRNL